MTMNNDFYKTLNAEIEKKTNQQGSRLYVRDPELDEDKQSQQIDYFVQERVNRYKFKMRMPNIAQIRKHKD